MTGSVTLLLGLTAVFAGLVLATLVVGGALGERRQVQRSLQAVALGGATSPGAAPCRQRIVVPALDRFSALGRRLSPSSARERLLRQLDLAGNPTAWTFERVLAAKALALVGTAVLGVLLLADGGLLRAVVLAAPAAGLAFWLPDVLLYNAGQKRQQRIQKSLPDALDLLTVSVEAGLGFDAALSQVAKNTEGPLAGEFFRVLQEMQMKSRSDAFRALGERTTVADLRTFVSALVQADRLGVPIGRVLREQSKEMRLKRRQRAEEQAMKVPVKILFPMVVCILPVLFIVVLAPAFMSLAETMQGG